MRKFLVALALLVSSCGFSSAQQVPLADEILTQIEFTRLTSGLQLEGGFEISGNSLIAERMRLERYVISRGAAILEGNLRAINFNGLTFCLEPDQCVVAIDVGSNINTQVSVLLHELTHLEYFQAGLKLSAKEGEVVAEITSFLVMKNIGVDTRRESLGYVVRWVPEPIMLETLKTREKFIRATVEKFTKVARGDEVK